VRVFTPEWYARTQADDAYPDVWERAFSRYNAHLDRIRPRLTPALRRFADLQFHDCQVREVRLLQNSDVEVALHGFRRTRAGKHPVNGIHRVLLRNVIATNLNPSHVGDWWLYEEVDVTRRGYRLSALLHDVHAVLWFEFETLFLKSAG